ncbi:hypothetical protein AKJ40_01260 [candidate division MSBL1 archaeon SCGC-AAA259M10]|uniref:Thioredoxin domain-containing protein n=2 Tax=candidate division MSBL1 TaxID=215777 RepID=A0A133V209_9EURY|nr:hypothetical protein AKJ36_00965 [candidate division MSBL1 archaeon SCGC-AAA259I07]KXB00469.1 hypothetical protein AKJ40_01260 [candidate division MSBL1 archaeon SCGC-AAA259M10]
MSEFIEQKDGTLNKMYLVIFVYIIVGLVVLGFVLTQSNQNENSVNEIGTKIGKKAPDFTVQTIRGDYIELANLQGEIVILDFMATWCPPCRREILHLKEVYSNKSYENLRIISIDIDASESIDELTTFKEAYKINWILARGPSLGEKYKISSIPTIYILNEHGNIYYKNVGVTSASEILEKLKGIRG